MPNDTEFAPHLRVDVVEAALAGLTASPKTLPAKLFYDDEGCRLFYQITRLPEYYLTRTETALLRSIASAVIPPDFRDAALIEFGGSDETKARILLDRPETPFNTYLSIDVAADALIGMRHRLNVVHPNLNVITIVADFMQPLALPPLGSQRMGFFPRLHHRQSRSRCGDPLPARSADLARLGRLVSARGGSTKKPQDSASRVQRSCRGDRGIQPQSAQSSESGGRRWL